MKKGKRCSRKFKVIFKQQVGPISILDTNIGSILYSKYNKNYQRLSIYFGRWTEIIRLSNSFYFVRWRGTCDAVIYHLFNEKLERVLDEYGFNEIQRLTANLIAVKTDNGWGIVDGITGNMIEKPKYFSIKVGNDGKIIGKTREIVETEIIINE